MPSIRSSIAQLLKPYYVHSIHYFIVLKNTADIETEKQPIPLCSLEISLPIGIRYGTLIQKKTIYAYICVFKRRPLAAFLAALEAYKTSTPTNTKIVSLIRVKRRKRTDECHKM
jgi:hypothetical protein